MRIAKKKLLKELRFGQKLAFVKEIRCPLCSEIVDKEAFRNDMFKREFETTGLCQACLDLVFGYQIAWWLRAYPKSPAALNVAYTSNAKSGKDLISVSTILKTFIFL